MMLVNMAKVPFRVLQFAYIYPVIPIVANLLGAETQLEVNLTRMCAVVAFLNFALDITILSRQFMKHTGRTFFIRKILQDPTSNVQVTKLLN